MSQPPASPSRPPFQFSLRWLLIFVTAAAVLLGLLAIDDSLAAVLFAAVAYCVVPTAVVIVVLFGRGEIRTFAIGALVPWIMAWVDSPGSPGGWPRTILAAFWLLVLGGICGIVAVATRRWLERRYPD